MKYINYLIYGSVFIGICGLAYLLIIYGPVQSQEIPVTFHVVEGSEIGILKEERFLHFGHVSQGGGSERRITISDERDIRYRIYLSGPVRDYIHIEPWQKDLRAGEVQNVTFQLFVPEDLPLGEYNGTAHVEIYLR